MDKYKTTIDWSDEDNCYVGRVDNIKGGCHGDSIEEVESKLKSIVESLIRIDYEDDECS